MYLLCNYILQQSRRKYDTRLKFLKITPQQDGASHSQYPGPLFNKRMNVLPQDLVKYL